MSEQPNMSPVPHSVLSIYQDQIFLDVLAKHHKLHRLQVGGVQLLLNKIPLLGYFGGMMAGPEVVCGTQEWWEEISQLDFAYLLIRTNEKVEQLSSCQTSPADNYNMLVDLTIGAEGLLKSFQPRKQRTIRAALKKGTITFRVAENEADLQRVFAISHRLSQQGQLFELLPLELYREIWFSGKSQVFIVEKNRLIIGGIYCLLSGSVLHAWWGGVDKFFFGYNVWDLLNYKTMLWGIEHGFVFFDFGDQSISKQKTIASYKQRFRPIYIPAFHYIFRKSKLKLLLLEMKKKWDKGLLRHGKHNFLST